MHIAKLKPVFILGSFRNKGSPLASQPPAAIVSISRDARKLRTRQHLMQAALTLVGQGRGFTSLSLREVTREIGVVPASFYRHFKDMDELGLALVEEGGVTLRRLLREARRSSFPPKDMIHNSVLIYKRYLEQNHLMFAFIVGERSGGSPVIRPAIRREE